jgi:hypothetical protein
MLPLHDLGRWLRAVCEAIPLVAARGLFVALLLALLIWVLTLPREATTRSSGPTRLSENLKIWAAAAVLIQLVIYALV